MKTIFIFDDSRATEDVFTVKAIGEDGQRIKEVTFDAAMMPFSRYALCETHEIRCNDPSITEPVKRVREATLTRYDFAYGRGNWFPIWLEEPRDNPAFCRALYLANQRDRMVMAPTPQPYFSGRALANILGVVFDDVAVTPATATRH